MKSCWIYCGAPSKNFNIYPPENSYVIAADSGYSLVKKLGIKPGDNRYIINELGVGYRISEESI